MNEKEIKRFLHELFSADDSLLKYFDEWEIARTCIADCITIDKNGFNCYEIKGENDNLKRLPLQLKSYDKFFNTITIVAHEKHIQKLDNLPEHIGIWSLRYDNGEIQKTIIKEAKINHYRKSLSVLQCLWKSEITDLLKSLKVKGISKLRRKQLWSLGVKSISLDEITTRVRDYIIERKEWKPIDNKNI